MCHTFILNKLALVPFQEDQQQTHLYQQSLEILLELPKEYFRNDSFVGDLTDHLVTWEKRMGQFGSWPYTRAAFYSIEEKVKKNKVQYENIVLKRALLEPNKK